jgi:peptidoglycan/LPS O-acetylase OafA/YrhL
MLVVFCHFQVPGFEGGGIGVDIFFVLSGFLITRVLSKDLDGDGSLFPFYWRRFLRLTPALVTLCVALGGFSLLFPDVAHRNDVILDAKAALLSVANWTRAFSLGLPMYLGNCWSLSIEEQFYLLWPGLFLLLHKRRRSFLPPLTFLLLCLSVAWSYLGTILHFDEDRIYNGFDTHCSGLLLGCLLALVWGRPRFENYCHICVRMWPLAILAILFLVGFKHQWSPSTGLVCALSTAILIAVCFFGPDSILGRFLTLPALVAIGKISYGLYLWHYPIFLIMFLKRLPWHVTAAIGIPLSFVTAALSYSLIEKPLLRGRYSRRLPLRSLGMLTLSCSWIALVAGSVLFFGESIADAFSTGPTQVLSYEPRRISAGAQFNVQADGESYLWMKVSRTLPKGAQLRVGDRFLAINNSGRALSALLPRELLSQPREFSMVVVDVNNQPLTAPVSLEVIQPSP